jgi:hypothetical protein
MYYVMIAERSLPAVARSIGRAESSTAARRLAVSLDIALHGRPSGRLFYLDQETFIAWCARGKAVAAAPGALAEWQEPTPATGEAAAHPAIRPLA